MITDWKRRRKKNGGKPTFGPPGWVGKKPEKNPPSAMGLHALSHVPWTTLWFLAQKRNSRTSPGATLMVLGSKVRLNRPTAMGMVMAVACESKLAATTKSLASMAGALGRSRY